ncbi:DsbC family protein, partial [Francisella tularensis subsp. holarctica]|nr:DsbC family protein [Francisella tularensis subsp. holarctica]
PLKDDTIAANDIINKINEFLLLTTNSF